MIEAASPRAFELLKPEEFDKLDDERKAGYLIEEASYRFETLQTDDVQGLRQLVRDLHALRERISKLPKDARDAFTFHFNRKFENLLALNILERGQAETEELLRQAEPSENDSEPLDKLRGRVEGMERESTDLDAELALEERKNTELQQIAEAMDVTRKRLHEKLKEQREHENRGMASDNALYRAARRAKTAVTDAAGRTSARIRNDSRFQGLIQKYGETEVAKAVDRFRKEIAVLQEEKRRLLTDAEKVGRVQELLIVSDNWKETVRKWKIPLVLGAVATGTKAVSVVSPETAFLLFMSKRAVVASSIGAGVGSLAVLNFHMRNSRHPVLYGSLVGIAVAAVSLIAGQKLDQWLRVTEAAEPEGTQVGKGDGEIKNEEVPQREIKMVDPEPPVSESPVEPPSVENPFAQKIHAPANMILDTSSTRAMNESLNAHFFGPEGVFRDMHFDRSAQRAFKTALGEQFHLSRAGENFDMSVLSDPAVREQFTQTLSRYQTLLVSKLDETPGGLRAFVDAVGKAYGAH